MKLADVDWSILRGSIIFLVLSVVVAAALLIGSYQFWGAMTTEFDGQRQELQTVRRKYHTVDEEERIIEVFLPRYQDLQAEGIIGREYRLNWIENLRTVSKDLKLPNLRYAINTQEMYEPAFPVQDGAFKVYVSLMTLDLGLLHEGDLLRFFQELDQRAAGLYSVSDCAINRSSGELKRDPTEANLMAKCTLKWYTVKQAET